MRFSLRLTVSSFLFQFIGGYFANSVAIMSDAAHLFSDLLGHTPISLVIFFGCSSPHYVVYKW